MYSIRRVLPAPNRERATGMAAAVGLGATRTTDPDRLESPADEEAQAWPAVARRDSTDHTYNPDLH